jgi:glutathione reductase (NADPH)
MGSYDFDFFVIGGGSGGVRAARMAASFGASTALVEEKYLGGTCVNVGCVPKKLFVYASEYSAHARDGAGFGWTMPDPTFDWATLVANKDTEISRLNGIYDQMLNKAGVRVIEGRGVMTGPHSVRVGDTTYTAERILLAVGGTPHKLPIQGAEHCITSDEIFSMPEFPKRLLIVGGGYVGVEFAGVFQGLGSRVTQIYRGELFLRGFDDDIRAHLAEQMIAQGMDLRFETNLVRVVPTETGLSAELTDGSTLEVDAIFMATGRHPNTAGLGLEEVGVKMTCRGAIRVDHDLCTNIPSIFACGDVIERVALTPVALAEGMMLARNLYAGGQGRVSYENIPTAVFSQPNIGTVGLTEEEAHKHSRDVVVYKSSFRPMRHTMSGRQERTLMKLVVCGETDKVLGCHMCGPDAGEIVQGLGIALTCGATKAQFDATIGIHPTAAEEFVTMRTPSV